MLQLAILVWGIVILAKQRVKFSATKVVTGRPAIAIGSIFVSVLPVGFMLGLVLGVLLTMQGIATDALMAYAVFMDIGLLVLAVVGALAIAARYGTTEEVANAKGMSQASSNVTLEAPSDPSNPYSSPAS